MPTDETLSRILDDLLEHLRQHPAGAPILLSLQRNADGSVEGEAWPGDEDQSLGLGRYALKDG